MRRSLWTTTTGVALVGGGSIALSTGPSTNTNFVASVGDAFGRTLGRESIAGSSGIRGFSPLTEGNVTIDGLYFDLQGSMIDRLATETRIRVGLSATEFPWSAPSGIVDYTLREPRAATGVTSIFHGGAYDSHDIDLGGSTEFMGGKFGLATGITRHGDAFNPVRQLTLSPGEYCPNGTPSIMF